MRLDQLIDHGGAAGADQAYFGHGLDFHEGASGQSKPGRRKLCHHGMELSCQVCEESSRFEAIDRFALRLDPDRLPEAAAVPSSIRRRPRCHIIYGIREAIEAIDSRFSAK